MRVLVTGGAGFIGSHLVDALIGAGHDVTVIDDLSTGREENLAQHRGEGRLRFLRGSVLDGALVERAMEGVELVYHLAAVVGVRRVVEDPLRTLVVNVHGTERVLEAAERCGARVVVVSSSEVYGKSTDVPLREDGDRLMGSVTVGRWAYAVSKVADEYLALGYARRGVPATVVRYFNAYGPRMQPGGYGSVVARFVQQALRGEPITVYGDGQQTRCFTFVEDTVRGTIAAGTHPRAVGEVFNLGSSDEIALSDLAELIREMTGSSSPIVFVPYEEVYGPDFEDVSRRVPDVHKAEAFLGFRAQVSLEEGLRRTISWFRGVG